MVEGFSFQIPDVQLPEEPRLDSRIGGFGFGV